jgi:hypothetical protein
MTDNPEVESQKRDGQTPTVPQLELGVQCGSWSSGLATSQYELLRLGNDQPVYPASSRVDETRATAALPNELMSRPVAALTRIH